MGRWGVVSEKMFFGPLGLSLIQKQGGPSPGSTVVHSTMGVFFVEFWSSAGRRISQPGGIPLGILGGAVPSGSPNPNPLRPKKCHFHTRFHTFQTSLLKSIPVFRPGIRGNYFIIIKIRTPTKRFLKSISKSHIILPF